jgi:citrate synthase
MRTDAEVTVGKVLDVLQLIDDRNGSTHLLRIHDDAIDAMDLRKVRATPDSQGLASFDPGFVNTAACRSAITFIDGDRGVLEYRGYPIEQIAGNCSFLEVGYLLINGELPGPRLGAWEASIANLSMLPQDVHDLIERMPPSAHPMNVLAAVVALLGGVYADSRDTTNAETRKLSGNRLIAQVPLIAALVYRNHQGLPFVHPDPSLGYVANFINMMFAGGGSTHDHPDIHSAIETLLVLHADHEQNCSTNVLRGIASADADPYISVSGAMAALSGPLHGGANEAVLKMLHEIGSVDRVPEFITKVKAGDRRLMGFGHRVYKNFDPRGLIVKASADKVFAVTGINPLLEVAIQLERSALADDYFISRKLYPNVDFYSGLVYEAMGLPADMFTVMFAIARTVGWVAHWLEFEVDPDKKISRPRQLYTGSPRRDLPASRGSA